LVNPSPPLRRRLRCCPLFGGWRFSADVELHSEESMTQLFCLWQSGHHQAHLGLMRGKA
jgi:hypothetical protein